MKFYIPYTYEMCGMVPIEAETLKEAKAKAEKWLEECGKGELARYADMVEASEMVNEEHLARLPDGRYVPCVESGLEGGDHVRMRH